MAELGRQVAGATVEYETHYTPQQIPISQACGLVWNCTDIMPGELFGLLQDAAQDAIKLRTYAACARYILDDIKAASAEAA